MLTQPHYNSIPVFKPALRSPAQTDTRKRDRQIAAIYRHSKGRYFAFHLQDKRLTDDEQRLIEKAFKRIHGRDPDPETYEGGMFHFGGLLAFETYSRLIKAEERVIIRMAFRRLHPGLANG